MTQHAHQRRQVRALTAKARGMEAACRVEAAQAAGDTAEYERAVRWCRRWTVIQSRYRD